MNKRVAVMDLGTNTFHLLIAEGSAAGFTEIEHQQDAVKLGESGINQGLIQPAAFERGINAMLKFNALILQHHATQVKAIATSALRNAANGQNFINQVKAQTGIAIEIIDGAREAAYIYNGVKAGGCLGTQNSLIVDIGGGSVEFIICNRHQIKWKQSFEIGVARLMDMFHKTDPIHPRSVQALNNYLDNCLTDLFAQTAHHSIQNIIGSSGVFETYAVLIDLRKGTPFNLKTNTHYQFNKNDLSTIINELISSSHRERAATKGIVPIRVDMIVTASVLTRFVMQKLGVDTVIMSTNSLKEGVLAEMMA